MQHSAGINLTFYFPTTSQPPSPALLLSVETLHSKSGWHLSVCQSERPISRLAARLPEPLKPGTVCRFECLVTQVSQAERPVWERGLRPLRFSGHPSPLSHTSAGGQLAWRGPSGSSLWTKEENVTAQNLNFTHFLHFFPLLSMEATGIFSNPCDHSGVSQMDGCAVFVFHHVSILLLWHHFAVQKQRPQRNLSFLTLTQAVNSS